MRRVLLVSGAVVGVFALVGVGLTMGRLGALAVLGLFAIVVLSFLPVRLLPALALTLWVLVPRRLTVELVGVDMVYPLSFILAVWAVRVLLTPRLSAQHAKLTVPFFLFGVWLVFVTLVTREWGQSVTWILAFALLWMAPALLSDRSAVETLRAVWMVLAVAVGLYALTEAVLQRNPVYDALFAALGVEDTQRWSVYRASATFGHPLYASMFFSASFALALGKFVERPQKRMALVAVVAIAAMVTTVSRSGLAAAGVAAAVVLLLAVVRARSIPGVAKFLLVFATSVGLFLAVTSGAFAERSASGEASSSSDAREWVVDLAFDAAAESNWIGTGPGTSADAVRALDSYQILVENGYLQLLVSTGVIGALLFIYLIVRTALRGIARQRYGGLGGVVALAVSIAGFNALESSPSIMILLGAAFALVWVHDDEVAQPIGAVHVNRTQKVSS